MPYQDSNNDNSNNLTAEEYFRLRRLIQSQGGPSRNQHHMQAMPPQRMMQVLQSMEFQAQGSVRRDRQLYGNTLHLSMSNSSNDFQFGSGNKGSGHSSNMSRSFADTSLKFDQFNRGVGMPNTGGYLSSNDNTVPSQSFAAKHCSPSLSSLDPRFNNISGLDNARRSFAGTKNHGGINNNNADSSSLFASTHSDGGFYANSTFNRGRNSSTANLPPNSIKSVTANNTFRSYNADDDNTVDLTNSPALKGKRRRLNSDELVLNFLLSDIAPVAANKNGVLGNDNRKDSYIEDYAGDLAARCHSPVLSPFSRRNAMSSPTLLNQSNGFAESDSPMGQTPIMFAKFFLDAKDEEDDIGAAALKAAIPVPPLYQSGNESKRGGMGGMEGFSNHQGGDGGFGNAFFQPQRGGGIAGRPFAFTEVQFDPEWPSVDQDDILLKTPFSSEPLCLPPRRKKKTTPKSNKKVATKKSLTKTVQEREGIVESPSRTAINHVTTPSSDVIVALSTEIRNQMQSSPGSGDANDSGCSSPKSTEKTVDSSTKTTDGFSIPHFATSMEASQFSQQSIHDWDKKFGLRRAHSKTMRESARSRKHVLELLKGDGSDRLKNANAVGLTESTSTSTTFTSSLSFGSSTSTMLQDEAEQNIEVELKTVDTVQEGSEGETSEESKDHHLDDVLRYEDDKTTQVNNGAISSSVLLDRDDNIDDDKSIGSIGSFSHYEEEIEKDSPLESFSDEDDVEKDSHELTASYSSKILDFDFEDEELTKLFRRASLDHCIRRPSLDKLHRRSSSVLMPMPEDSDRKDCFAKSA